MSVLIRADWVGSSTLKRTRHTADQIIRKLKTAEQLIPEGKSVVDLNKRCSIRDLGLPLELRVDLPNEVFLAVFLVLLHVEQIEE